MTVESRTGGGVAQACTSIAGSSRWFERGMITYSNSAKSELAGVDAGLIDQYGAVSEEVVRAMAIGGIQHSYATDSVAITGIAGPDGGSRDKPVGTVWIGWAQKQRDQFSVVSKHHLLQGDRESIRSQSVILALEGLTEG